MLESLGVAFEVVPAPVPEPECPPRNTAPRAWAASLSYFKARAVAEQNPQRWVLGADTIVACGSEVLGKPRDAEDARRMLKLQAGARSEVITGVSFVRLEGEFARRVRVASTSVWMRRDPELIESYVAGGEWAGKAGAYGIQDVGDRLVERIEGSFSNVVGLPVEVVKDMLGELEHSHRPVT